jgi:hypothetical protein
MKRLPLCALLCLGLLAAAVQAEASRAVLPYLRVPQGWDVKEQKGGLFIKPLDAPEGKEFTVLVPVMTAKAGSLSRLLQMGETKLKALGIFERFGDPVAGQNETGWDYLLVSGTLKTTKRAIVCQLMALRRGTDEALILVLSDSYGTLSRYLHPFMAMVGVPRPPAPAVGSRPSPPAPSGRITITDLVGEWAHGGSERDARQDARAGAGSSATATNATYTLRANGSYTHELSTMANGRVATEKWDGTFSVAGGLLVLQDHRITQRYHIVRLSAGTLTLLVVEQQLNDVNVSVHGERWVRKAP